MSSSIVGGLIASSPFANAPQWRAKAFSHFSRASRVRPHRGDDGVDQLFGVVAVAPRGLERAERAFQLVRFDVEQVDEDFPPPILPDGPCERARLEMNPAGLEALRRHADEARVSRVEGDAHLVEPARALHDVLREEGAREAGDEPRQVLVHQLGEGLASFSRPADEDVHGGRPLAT